MEDKQTSAVDQKIVDARKERFNFLGFTIGIRKSQRTGKRYPHVQPSKKSVQTIKDRVTQHTGRKRTVMPLEWIVKDMVREWVGKLAKVRLFRHRQTKEPETDKPNLKMTMPVLYSTTL